MSSAPKPSHPELRRSWRAVLGKLEESMNPFSFNTWLRGTEPLRADGRTIVIEARHGADPTWLNQQLSCVVARAVEGIFGDGFRASFVPSAFATPAASAPGAAGSEGSPARDLSRTGAVLGLVNRHYTFDRYLPASGNKLALQACLDLLATSPRAASPVVMFGEPGLGKTHLLHALATRAAAQGWSVACLGAEQFTNRFQQALRDSRASAFQEDVRNVNLLLIDDLQFFLGRPATVVEFANTLEEVTNAGGLIACASECNPDRLELPNRLISRLKGGILAPMQPLNAADRRAYISVRAREERLSLPSWAIDAVAACEAPSIRVLQGAVNTTLALQRTGELDQATLREHLRQFCAEKAASPEALDTRGIIEAVAAHFAVTRDDLLGRGRTRRLEEARAVAMAALLEGGRTLAQVAAIFANRHRSTVNGAGARGRALLELDPALRARLVAS